MRAAGLDTAKMHIDLNVKLAIPEQTRTDADGNPASDAYSTGSTIPAVDLWPSSCGRAAARGCQPSWCPPATAGMSSSCSTPTWCCPTTTCWWWTSAAPGLPTGWWYSFDTPEHYDIAYVVDRWIPAQAWSDGTVGMIGPSYLGITQLLTAGNVERDAKGERST